MPKIKSKNHKPNIYEKPEIDYPVFCFKHLQDVSIKQCKDSRFLSDFIFRLSKLCQMGWTEIGSSHKHSFGTEKIPIENIKPKLPSFVSPEVKHLLVFRACGDNRPFLGIRNGSTFHILYIESKFGDIYNHG